jgi:hypothetical protein
MTVVIHKGTVPFASNEHRDSPPLVHSPILGQFVGAAGATVAPTMEH